MQKKTKRVPLVLPDVPVDDLLELDDSPDALSTVDIDFPSTSTSDEAPATLTDEREPAECSNRTDFEKSLHSQTKWQEEELAVEASAPSAPMMEFHEAIQPIAPLYPDLAALRIAEQSAAMNVAQCVEAVEPFTREQLGMFYRLDDQLRLAETFEQEFIVRELEENSLCLNHPLYQLLQRYAKARADLTVSILELDALRRKCKELAMELWVLREQKSYASGRCHDGIMLQSSCDST